MREEAKKAGAGGLRLYADYGAPPDDPRTTHLFRLALLPASPPQQVLTVALAFIFRYRKRASPQDVRESRDEIALQSVRGDVRGVLSVVACQRRDSGDSGTSSLTPKYHAQPLPTPSCASVGAQRNEQGNCEGWLCLKPAGLGEGAGGSSMGRVLDRTAV